VTPPRVFDLTGRVAVVVGGAGGLGAAIARGLAEAGAAVAVADAAVDRAAKVAADIPGAVALEVDVTERRSVERMAAEAGHRLGAVDVLVNCAGITRRAPAVDFADADWHRVLAVNLTGVFLACQVIGAGMLARGRGRIVNIASIAGEIGLPGTIAYTATKGGVIALTRGLAVEWAPHVRVNAIAPSWFETSLGGLIHREPEYEARAMRRVPMGRMGQPDELVGAAVFLASDASAMVTGHVLAVDGGVLAS
jgi:gluconate 5-dehydrogenase